MGYRNVPAKWKFFLNEKSQKYSPSKDQKSYMHKRVGDSDIFRAEKLFSGGEMGDKIKKM